MEPYRHIVQYYETDKMGITHHSNYVRWMEEARLYFLGHAGLGYDQLEKAGIFSPVTAISCKYIASTTFPDEITIELTIPEFRDALLKLHYIMTKQDGQKVFEGESVHCFLNREGRIVRLSRAHPELHALFASLVQAGDISVKLSQNEG